MASYTPRPFVRDRYEQNSRLADLMMQQGRNAANAQRQQGDISAQMWGNVGNTISNAIGQYVETKKDEPRRELQAAQLKSAKIDIGEKEKAVAAADAYRQIIANTPQLDEDGVSLYDISNIGQQLAAQGFDPGESVKHLNGINEAFRQERAAKLAVVQRGAQAVIAGGNDPVLANHFLDRLEKNGTVTKDQAQQYREFMAADPANVAKITASLAGPRKFENAPAGSVSKDPLTGMIVPGSEVPEKAGDGDYTINGQRFKKDGTPLGAVVPSQAIPVAKGLQTEKFRLNGRDVMGTFDPATGKYMYNGADVTAEASPIPAASIQINAANRGTSDLPTGVQRRVDSKSKSFEVLPVVKRTQTMSEAVGFANGLDVNTKNPQDDQALIYAYAKAMDPDSVVREGEYATVQKYSQSWAEALGFKAARVFSNTTFLTVDARKNMKATIQAKFGATKKQYDAVRKSYVDQVNQITGRPDGADYLTDFGAAFPKDAGVDTTAGHALGANTTQVVEQGGVRFKVTTDASGKVISSEVVR